MDDLDEVLSFFLGLGFIWQSSATRSGPWLEHVTKTKGAEVEITLLQSPAAETHIELLKYNSAIQLSPQADPTILRPGFRMVGLLTENLAETVDLAVSLGGKLISPGIERFDAFWVAYVLAPGNIILMLTEDVPWDEL